MIVVRRERPEDRNAVRTLNEAAFGGPIEAGIVDAVREACPDAVSLVAVEGAEIVGHILFSPVGVTAEAGIVNGMGLGPMCVMPERQRQGIGSRLVEVGLDVMKGRRCPFVVVIGHPGFYPRFGFRPARSRGLLCPWDGIPDEAFMVSVLDDDSAVDLSGMVAYRPEFDVS